ncbi:MAG: response regulator transcription factor [Ignavibacteriales bacterium]|nr:response regulator transcription factor [Ignavibacteriales bacterium]
MIRIFIADDHAVVRQGIKQIIEEQRDMLVIGEAKNAQETLDFLHKKIADVVILDISMPGKTGLEILKDLKHLSKNLHVLVLSMYPEEQFATRAIKSGASGYMTKESAPEELVRAIRRVYSGGKYVSAALAEKLIFDFETDQTKPPHELLSDREFQVLCLMGMGKTASEIAKEISLSVKTISTYRSRILEKMKMKSNAELTRYSIKNKLVE